MAIMHSDHLGALDLVIGSSLKAHCTAEGICTSSSAAEVQTRSCYESSFFQLNREQIAKPDIPYNIPVTATVVLYG